MWEERSIFLNFLVSKLPSPREEDLSKGILDVIDMDSYRVEKWAMQKINLPDGDAEIDGVPGIGTGGRSEADLDRLSNIIRDFNDLFGDIPWEDADRVRRLVTETIPSRVAQDTAFKNAQKNSDRENARIEHDEALITSHHRCDEGRHRVVQAVHGQPGIQTMDERDVVPARIQAAGDAIVGLDPDPVCHGRLSFTVHRCLEGPRWPDQWSGSDGCEIWRE